MKAPIFNASQLTPKASFVSVRNEAGTGPVTLMIYGSIGQNPWTGDGISSADFKRVLDGIPAGRQIECHINSQGGDSAEGIAIYNQLKARRNDVTCVVDAVAASIASIIMLAGKECVMPSNTLCMIHNPETICYGDEADMLQAAQRLAANKAALVSTYEEETGQSASDISAKMDATTWMTGQEACDYGLCDRCTDAIPIAASLDGFDLSRLSRFPNAPSALVEAAKNQATNTMKRHPILLDPQAPVNNAGGAPAAAAAQPSQPATPAAPPAAPATPPPVTNAADPRLADVVAFVEAQRRERVTAQVDALILDRRVIAGQRDFWIAQALANADVLNQLRAQPQHSQQADPVRPLPQITNEDPTAILRHMHELRTPMRALFRNDSITPEQVSNAAHRSGMLYEEHRNRILPVLNANTIGSDLQRTVILQEIIRAFALRILPLKAFFSQFEQIPLQGTDKITVPYFALVSTASTDFVAANGYVMGDSAQSNKTITINKRKYQPIRFTSSELARQPAYNLGQIAQMKAEKLGSDVFTDVLSIVTAANYGAAAFTGLASTVTMNTLADLKGTADVADWPDVGRSLIWASAYDVAALKLSGIQAALNFGEPGPVQRGKINTVFGFDYYMCNKIPGNAENLVGAIVFKSAAIFASSPIMPAADVRNLMTAYEVVTDPITGTTFEYRRWGNPDYDEAREVIECNYGYAVGESAALKRIVSA